MMKTLELKNDGLANPNQENRTGNRLIYRKLVKEKME